MQTIKVTATTIVENEIPIPIYYKIIDSRRQVVEFGYVQDQNKGIKVFLAPTYASIQVNPYWFELNPGWIQIQREEFQELIYSAMERVIAYTPDIDINMELPEVDMTDDGNEGVDMKQDLL